MKKIDFFNIKVTFSVCEKLDLMSKAGINIHNKMFFLKNEDNFEFYSCFKMDDNNFEVKDARWKRNFQHDYEMVEYLVRRRLIYKITDLDHNPENQYYLTLRTAEKDNLIYSEKYLKVNATYFLMDAVEHQISGPFYIKEYDDFDKFERWIAQSKLFVPSKKQLFEKVKIKNIA